MLFKFRELTKRSNKIWENYEIIGKFELNFDHKYIIVEYW